MDGGGAEEEQRRSRGGAEEEDELSRDSDAGSDQDENQGKDLGPEAESETGNQEGAGAELPGKETGEIQEETHKESQVGEFQDMGAKLLEKKKPARNLLDSLRNRNAKGL